MSAEKYAVTADGVITKRVTTGDDFTIKGSGNFGGGTITIEFCEEDSATDADWIPDQDGDGVFTDDFVTTISNYAGYWRIKLTGATDPDIDLGVTRHYN